MFSKKATKIYEIFASDLTLCSKCQIDVEDFVNFLGFLRKHELYALSVKFMMIFFSIFVAFLENMSFTIY